MTLQQTPPQKAIFPDIPRNEPFLDSAGFINPYWKLFFDNLIMALQTNFKPEGIVVPELPTSDINLLTDVTKSIGNIIYDSTTNQFKGNLNGAWVIFVTM